MPRLAHALIVVLVALTVRTAFQRSAEAYPRLEMIRNALDDQVLYVTWAAALAQGAAMDWADTGHEFAYWAPRWPGVHPQDPGYVYALAAVFRAAGFAFDAIRALQAALGAGTALLAWTLARRHVGPGAALAAGVAAALYQPLVFYEATLLREPLATFLCAAALVACSAAEAGATRRRAVLAALGAGLLLGLAVLVRSHLALPAAAIAAWLLVSTRRRLGAGVALALAFAAALPVLPVVAGNVARSGRPAFVSSAGPYNLFIGNVHDGGGAASPHYHAVKAQGPPQAVDLLAALRDDVAAHPGAFAARLVDKVRVLLGPAEVPDNLSVAMGRRLAGALKVAVVTDAVLLPAALVGMALAGAAWRRHALLYVYALGYAASVVPFVVVSRLRQPLLPVLAVFAALALQQIVAWARARRTRWRAALAAAVMVAMAVAGSANPRPREVDFLMAAAAYARLGELREAAGDAAGARRAYGRAAALNPDHGQAVAGAVRLRAALPDVPADAEAAVLCAQAREAARAGQVSEARRLLDRAARRAPDWALPYAYRAQVHALAGDAPAAEADFERAVALDPGDARLREGLRALRRTPR